MANEAVCYEAPTRFARYTVSSAAAIPKGTLLRLNSPNTAVTYASYTGTAAHAGIAWMEKVASPTDGSTEIVAALDGTWGLVASTGGAVNVGYDVTFCGANKVRNYTTLNDEKGYVAGKFLETIGTSGARVKVKLNL